MSEPVIVNNLDDLTLREKEDMKAGNVKGKVVRLNQCGGGHFES